MTLKSFWKSPLLFLVESNLIFIIEAWVMKEIIKLIDVLPLLCNFSSQAFN